MKKANLNNNHYMRLNQAIWTVLTSKYKKNAPEAFKMVTDHGYIIDKNGYGWEIKNPVTGRKVFTMERGYSWNRHLAIVSGWYESLVRDIDPAEHDTMGSKFDFVNCLNTPINDTYYKPVKTDNKATSKYNKLTAYRRNVDYEKDEIQKIRKEMDRLQTRLEMAIERRTQDEQALTNYKKEIGLI